MLTRVQNRLRRFHFDQISRRIIRTPAIATRSAPLRIVSMVKNTDLYMYLGAIKSLYRAIGEGNVTVINDGSLTPAMLDILSTHIPGLTLIHIGDINTGRCPRGGTWERLVLIVEYSRDAYVIQMDSDTLTIGPMEYVTRSYRENRSFGLGTSAGKQVVSVHEISEWASRITDPDVSFAAERRLQELPGNENLRYFRGSSGFAGFARGVLSVKELEDFSDHMRELIGGKWDEWGSEQVASNFTVANTGAAVLPFPAYSCYYPHLPVDYSKNEFIHFIGSHRYHNGFYAQQFAKSIRLLSAA